MLSFREDLYFWASGIGNLDHPNGIGCLGDF